MDIVMLVSDVCPMRIDDSTSEKESHVNDSATTSFQLSQIGQIE